MNAARWIRVAWWCVPVGYALVLAAPSVTLPRDGLGLRRFVTPPLSPDLRLAQTFTMTTDGLRAIVVVPVAVDRPVTGRVRLELYDVNDDGRAVRVRGAEAPAGEPIQRGTYRFTFDPILNSRDHMYRMDLVADMAGGIAFWATKGERYDRGHLHANGHER